MTSGGPAGRRLRVVSPADPPRPRKPPDARPVSRGPGAEAASAWSVRVHRDAGDLDRLAAEWRELYGRCADGSPFQSAAWLASWWRHYGRDGRLRVFTVHRNGRLVGAAPFMLARRFGMPVLAPLGSPLADYTDILVADADRDAVLARLAEAMLGQPGWCVADFSELRPGAAALDLRGVWPEPSWSWPGSPCMELAVEDGDDLLGRLPRRTAGKMRSKLRKIDAAGFATCAVPPEAAPVAVRRLLRLHARQWAGRSIDPEHLTARFRRHLEQALPEMIEDRQAAMFEYRLDGRCVASDLLVVGPTFVGAYLYGSDPALRRMIDVTLMLLRQDWAFTQATGRPVFSFMRGDEPYKQKWRPRRVRNQRLVLGRGRLATAYAALVSGRTRVVEWERRRRYVGGHSPEHPS